MLQRLCCSCKRVWWRCEASRDALEDCGAGTEVGWTGLSVFPTGSGPWCVVPGACSPPNNGWTLSCGASRHGPKSGQAACYNYSSTDYQRCRSGDCPTLFCLAVLAQHLSRGLRTGPESQQVKGCLSLEAGSSCDSQLQAQGEDGMGILTFQCFPSSYSFTLLQRSLRLHTARAVCQQLPSCCKVNTGSERSPVWIPEPEGGFIHLISRYADCDQHHSNYLSHLNELDTEIATLVIYTAPFIGKLKNARDQFP